MDPIIWTVIGVGIGSAGTLGAAFVTARGASRHQLLTQQRDKRRDAYAAFLAAARELDDTASPHVATGFNTTASNHIPVNTEEWSVAVSDGYRKLCAASQLVFLEGPESVASAAQEVLNKAVDLTMAANVSIPPGKLHGEDAALDTAANAFLDAAREAIKL